MKMGGKKRNLQDYIDVCDQRGSYILTYIPKNTITPIDGWLCNGCNKIFKTSYSNLVRGCWCKICALSSKKTVNDYKEICKDKGEYILDYIPKTTKIKIKGWKCNKCSNIFESSYKYVIEGCWCPPCSQSSSEKLARNIIEKYMYEKFDSCYPKWLERLQLYGYNKELKLAFEYQCIQNYKFTPFIHKYEHRFIEQQERDIKKVKLYQENGITLIIIPYTINHHKPKIMESFIFNKLIKHEYLIEINNCN